MHTHKSITVALVVGGLSLLAVAWFVFWGVRDGMPGWAVVGAVAIILFAATLTWFAYRPSEEQVLANRLLAEEGTRSRLARVLTVNRLGVKETESYRETTLALTIEWFGQADRTDTLTLAVDIEDAMLARFASGARIHVLQDPVRTHRIAIDRRRSPTHVS